MYTCFTSFTDFQAIYCRNAGCARQYQVENFTHQLHSICSTHGRTCTASRTYTFFQFHQFFIAFTAETSNVYVCFYYLLTTVIAGRHAAASNNHSGNIQTCCCLITACNDVITGSDHTNTIELVYFADCFYGHADNVTQNLFIFHFFNTIGDVAACSRNTKFHRNTACCPNPLFYCFCNLTQMGSSGRTFLKRVRYTNMRFCTNIQIAISSCFHHNAAMRTAFTIPKFGTVFAHCMISPLLFFDIIRCHQKFF